MSVFAHGWHRDGKGRYAHPAWRIAYWSDYVCCHCKHTRVNDVSSIFVPSVGACIACNKALVVPDCIHDPSEGSLAKYEA